jgi:predicted tellurium resistance membrane protein TerC
MKYEKKMDFPVIITIIGAVLLIVSFLLAQMQNEYKNLVFICGMILGLWGFAMREYRKRIKKSN